MTAYVRLLFFVLLANIGLSSFAQNERPVLTLKLRNGDVISGVTEISSINFKTTYGDLAFPIKDVAQLNLGINTFGVEKNNVTSALDAIQNGSANEASASFDKLIKMEIGSIPYIRDYIESHSYKKKEAEITVDLAYEVMLSRHNLTKAFKTKDVLQTNGATSIEGHYDFESIALETDYGRINVNRSKISTMTVAIKELNNANTGSFKLNANQNIAGNTNGGWVNTGILVKKDQSVKVTANGQVNIASLSNNTYTPDGGVNGSPGAKTSDPTYGCVVYKIGENGPVMRAGDNYQGRAESTGIIYVSIYESVFNAANTGSYTVKVTAN